MKFKKTIIAATLAISATVVLVAGCSSAADTASENLSTAADNFEIQRRIVFVNGITDKYLMVIEGRCSLGNFDTDKRLSVTCKVGDNEFKKHFLGLSDNVTYFVEQTTAASVSEWHYRVIFRPETLIPDVEIK